jgi:hypothetical protein
MSGTETTADGELLEFLGSVDGEGEGWGEYLEDTDLRRAGPPPVASPPPAAAPPGGPAASRPPAPAPPTSVPPTPAPAAPPARPPRQGSQP